MQLLSAADENPHRRNALKDWNRERYFPFVVLAAHLGLAFGILLARAVARPGH